MEANGIGKVFEVWLWRRWIFFFGREQKIAEEVETIFWLEEDQKVRLD
jgi:hypothetical protein